MHEDAGRGEGDPGGGEVVGEPGLEAGDCFGAAVEGNGPLLGFGWLVVCDSGGMDGHVK